MILLKLLDGIHYRLFGYRRLWYWRCRSRHLPTASHLRPPRHRVRCSQYRIHRGSHRALTKWGELVEWWDTPQHQERDVGYSDDGTAASLAALNREQLTDDLA